MDIVGRFSVHILRRLSFGVVALLVCSGFASYKHTMREIEANAALRREIARQYRSGKQTDLYDGHYQISREALVAAGLAPALVDTISKTVCDIDFDNYVHEAHYEAKNHDDRPLGVSSAEAFRHALRYHRERIAESWNSLSLGDLAHAAQIVSRALHVEQDFFAHSNFVDLSPTDRRSLFDCWTHYPSAHGRAAQNAAIEHDERCLGAATPEVNAALGRLKVTAYDPHAADKYRPTPDPERYAHDDFAKDTARYNVECERRLPDGRTTYEAARAAAVAASTASLRAWKQLCAADDDCGVRGAKAFIAVP